MTKGTLGALIAPADFLLAAHSALVTAPSVIARRAGDAHLPPAPFPRRGFALAGTFTEEAGGTAIEGFMQASASALKYPSLSSPKASYQFEMCLIVERNPLEL